MIHLMFQFFCFIFISKYVEHLSWIEYPKLEPVAFSPTVSLALSESSSQALSLALALASAPPLLLPPLLLPTLPPLLSKPMNESTLLLVVPSIEIPSRKAVSIETRSMKAGQFEGLSRKALKQSKIIDFDQEGVWDYGAVVP